MVKELKKKNNVDGKDFYPFSGEKLLVWMTPKCSSYIQNRK